MNKRKKMLSDSIIRKKLHSKSGESIAETLIALLISTLALTMLAGAISSAANIVERGRKVMEDYYTANDVVILQKLETASEGTVVLKENGTPISVDASKSSVSVFVNTQLSRYPVVSYKIKATPTPVPGGES